MPPVEWIAATRAKRGNRPEENEDAHAAAPDGAPRFAVADGASEGWESGPWAAHVAARYVAAPPGPADFAAWLDAARDWRPGAGPAGALAWYAEEKQLQGAFATLLGLELRPGGPTGWAWKAVAVGDACLFHLSGGALVTSAPLTAAAEFGSRPALLGSARGGPPPDPDWFAGRAAPGDLFLLATDAAAARLLVPAERPRAEAAARAALAGRTPAPLADWGATVQAATNDDVTVMAILLPAPPEAT